MTEETRGPHAAPALAVLIRARMAELPGTGPDGSMTPADLVRHTGLPRATVYAYTSGRISAVLLNDSVRAKIALLATALRMDPAALEAAVLETRPDHETEAVRLIRSIPESSRSAAIEVLAAFAAALRKSSRTARHDATPEDTTQRDNGDAQQEV